MSKEGSLGSQERLERSGRVMAEWGSSRGAEVGTSPLWTDARWGGGMLKRCCRMECLQPGEKPVQRDRLRLGGGGATEG